MQGITTNHIKDTPTMQSVPDQPPKQVPPKHTHYNPPGKIALRPSSIPTTEALNRIASAVNKSRRGFDETDALMRSGSGSECDEKRQMNGKYLEIPHLLDGFRMLNSGPAEAPEDIYSLDISGRDLKFVLEDDLSMFSKLQILKAGENLLPLARLGVIPNLRKLIFPCNGVSSLDLDLDGRFRALEYLDVSYNSLEDSALVVLATLPSLRYLDLTRNGIYKFPSTIKDMSLWRDRVIELLLPVQVAAMNFNKSSDKDDASRPHTAASKRSFARSMAASRPKTRPTVDRSEELKAETQNETKDLENFEKNIVRSRDSLPATPEDNTEPPSDAAPRHLRSPLTIGYPNLQTLILEGNHISTPDIFDTLGALPNLVTLNLNNNHIQSLNYFLAHGLSPKRALAEDPASLQKYSGFQNLEELAIKNNQIAAMENIIGLICLPALKRVHLGGNPVVTNVNFRSLAASNDPNPFNLFSSIYKITIVDLPKTQFVPHTNVLYAVAPTRYGPAVVRMTKTKEIPRSIGQILRRNAPTLVKGNRHVVHRRVSGTLDSELRESYQERQTRRAYSFTEEDIMNIIQMGTIPRIKELRVFADIREEMKAERRRQMGVDGLAESTDNNRPKTVEEPKVEQKKVTFDSTKKDATFITGVHITQQMPETVGSQAAKKVTPAESDSDSEDAHSDNEQMQQHILPLNIQGAVRALKHALSNPVSYWRIMEESYLRPTAASHNRFKEVKKNASQNYFDSPGEDYEDQEMTEDQLLNDLNAKAGTEFPTPANTIATPVYTARQRVEYEVKGYREPEKYALKQQDSSKFEELVTSKLMLDGTEKPSELSYLRKGKVTKKKNGLARAKQAGHLKPNTEFDEMSEMMGDVDKKLKLIEADLAAVLGNSSMRKRIPQSQKLLDEIQGEYARIEAAFLADAAVRIHGEDQHSDLYSIQGSDEYDEGRSRYGSSIDTSML